MAAVVDGEAEVVEGRDYLLLYTLGPDLLVEPPGEVADARRLLYPASYLRELLVDPFPEVVVLGQFFGGLGQDRGAARAERQDLQTRLLGDGEVARGQQQRPLPRGGLDGEAAAGEILLWLELGAEEARYLERRFLVLAAAERDRAAEEEGVIFFHRKFGT